MELDAKDEQHIILRNVSLLNTVFPGYPQNIYISCNVQIAQLGVMDTFLPWDDDIYISGVFMGLKFKWTESYLYYGSTMGQSTSNMVFAGGHYRVSICNTKENLVAIQRRWPT